jgi:hypothetical protein
MARLRILKALARKLLQLCQKVIEGDVDLRDIPAVDKQHLEQEVRGDRPNQLDVMTVEQAPDVVEHAN